MSVAPGAIIGGRYRLERRLGAGGVGEVWAGVRLDDGTKVAVKTLLPAASAHRELTARFRREADFLKRIRSRYVARVFDFLSDKTYGLVLVLELVEGEPLDKVLERTSLSIEEAIDVCWDVVGGISDLHRARIIHRDLKPGNVIVQKAATGKTHAVIVDFGMSRLTGVDQDGEEITALTRADIAVGTMEYMAPEQILNSRGVTGSTDIYALGAMLYRAVAGRHIFGELAGAELARHKLVSDSPPLVTGRSDPLARGFEAMVTKMVQRMPRNRYEKAEDVFADLAALRGGSPASPSSPQASSSPFASSPQASSPSFPVVDAPGHSSTPAAPSLRSTSLDAPQRSGSRAGWLVALSGLLVLAAAGAGGAFFWRQYSLRAAGSAESPGVEAIPGAPEPVPLATSASPLAPVPAGSASVTPEPSASAPAPTASVAIAPRTPAQAAPGSPTSAEAHATLPALHASAAPKSSAAPKASSGPAPRASGAPALVGSSKPSPAPAGPTPLEE